jgi:hypothetical protein
MACLYREDVQLNNHSRWHLQTFPLSTQLFWAVST